MITVLATLPPRSPAGLAAWFATSPPADVAIGLVVPVAGLLVAYLSAVSVLYVLALLVRAPRAVRRLAPVTPARIRAAAERAVAVGLVTASCAAPTAAGAAAAGPPPPGLRVPSASAGELHAPALDLPTEHAPPRAPEPPVVAASRAAGRVTVAPGDHLWAIAARAVAATRGVGVAQVAVPEVARYWISVIEHNRAHLRSGDPDLVHPGEEIRLPPVDGDASGTGR